MEWTGREGNRLYYVERVAGPQYPLSTTMAFKADPCMPLQLCSSFQALGTLQMATQASSIKGKNDVSLTPLSIIFNELTLVMFWQGHVVPWINAGVHCMTVLTVHSRKKKRKIKTSFYPQIELGYVLLKMVSCYSTMILGCKAECQPAMITPDPLNSDPLSALSVFLGQFCALFSLSLFTPLF